MSKISTKEYYCPVCSNVQNHSTNHTGEIYCKCKFCGNEVLYCVSGTLGVPTGRCLIHFYYFNLTNHSEGLDYIELTKRLESVGYKKWETSQMSSEAYEFLCKRNGSFIELYNQNQFKEQIVSSVGRVHYWLERTLPNQYIRSGYFLSFV